MEVGIFNKEIKIYKYIYHMLHGGSCFKKAKIVSKDGNHSTFSVWRGSKRSVYTHRCTNRETKATMAEGIFF